MSSHPLLPDFILAQDAAGQRKGTLLGATQFVDISGFTVLTEAMMQHGKEGAEQLAQILRFNFNPLVEAVKAAGGFITGFAGDAFTAVYPHHPDRDVASYALQASRQMQSFFAQHNVIVNSYGTFEFAVKVGLSWGQVEWEILPSASPQDEFTAADPPTYIFCGPGVDNCASSEKHAKKGDIVLDKAFLQQIGQMSLPSAGEGYFFDDGQHPIALPAAPLPAFQGKAQRFIPPEIETFPRTGEFRRVAVVFLSFENIPSLAKFSHELQSSLRQFGGTFTRFDFGDKGGNCLMFFGAPTAHENNEERALDFARELFQRHKNDGIALRAGITQNIMYVGFNGGDSRHEFACLGRAVTMAARLMMKAPWGEIWCAPRIYKRTQQLFHFESLGEWNLKGFAEPIPLSLLKSRKHDSQAQFSSVSMIGREGELKQLFEGLRQIFDKRFGGLFYVDGEAGMGKSYLVATCREQIQQHLRQTSITSTPPTSQPSFLWLYAPTNQTLQSSLHPFAYALRVWANQSPTASPQDNLQAFDNAFTALQKQLPSEEEALSQELQRLHSFLAALLGLSIPNSLYEQLEPRFRFANTLTAICKWLQALCTLQPVILQLEDGHWLDDASIQAFQQLLGQAQEWPLAIVMTGRYRDDGTPFRLPLKTPVPTTEINLNQLSRVGLQALAESHLGDTAHPLLLDLLEEKAHGNPFFVEQILSFLQDQQALLPTPQGLTPSQTGAILPEEVTSVLIARLDRLDTPVKHVVQVASTLGREFDVPILMQMLHTQQTDASTSSPEHISLNASHQWIQRAEDAQIWSSSGLLSYLFLHALMRDAAYDMQARARLRTLHKLAGISYEREFFADLKPHYGELAYHFEQAGASEKAAYYLEKAADVAKKDYRNQEALDFYRRLLSYLPPTGETTRQTYLALAEIMQILQRLDEGLEYCAKAEQAVDTPSPQVLYQKAFLTQMKGDFESARQLIEEAIALAQQQQNPEWESRCLNSLGVLYLYRSEIDEASKRFERSLELAKAANIPQIQAKAISNMAGVAMAKRDLEATRQYLEQSLALAREIKDRWTEFLSLGNLGELYLQMDAPQEALSALQQAIVTGTEIGTKNANFLANYGESMRRLGQLNDAQKVLADAEQFARSAGNIKHIIDVLYAQSKLALAFEDTPRARQALQEALQLASQSKQKALQEKLQHALEQLDPTNENESEPDSPALA